MLLECLRVEKALLQQIVVAIEPKYPPNKSVDTIFMEIDDLGTTQLTNITTVLNK